MRILLRADASPEGGVGHAMRLVALGEELVRRGHDVELRASLGGLAWLQDAVAGAGLRHVDAERDVLGSVDGVDAVVVDSYAIPASEISAAATHVPLLAIVDGDARGIEAGAYVDQNLGADQRTWPPGVAERMLAGPRFAVIRRAIVEAGEARAARGAVDAGATSGGRVLVVLGGTDARGGTARAVAAIAAAAPGAEITAVTRSADEVLAASPAVRVVAPGDGLPALLVESDVVVTAAGTSSWEICTIGVPAVFAAVVDNQVPSIRAIEGQDLGPVVDASLDLSAVDHVGPAVAGLLADPAARETASRRMRGLFDGRGADRVAAHLEGLVAVRE